MKELAVKKNGATLFSTRFSVCAPDKETVTLLKADGYKIYIEGKVASDDDIAEFRKSTS